MTSVSQGAAPSRLTRFLFFMQEPPSQFTPCLIYILVGTGFLMMSVELFLHPSMGSFLVTSLRAVPPLRIEGLILFGMFVVLAVLRVAQFEHHYYTGVEIWLTLRSVVKLSAAVTLLVALAGLVWWAALIGAITAGYLFLHSVACALAIFEPWFSHHDPGHSPAPDGAEGQPLLGLSVEKPEAQMWDTLFANLDAAISAHTDTQN